MRNWINRLNGENQFKKEISSYNLIFQTMIWRLGVAAALQQLFLSKKQNKKVVFSLKKKK